MKSFEDQLLKRSVLNQRVLGTLAKTITTNDKKLEKELLAYIGKNEIKTKRDINDLKAIVASFYAGEALESIRQEYRAVSTDFALAEAEQLESSFNVATIAGISATSLTRNKAEKIVKNSFFVNQTIDEFLNNYAFKQREEILKLARQAYSQGLTQQELSNQIAGTKGFNYKDGFFYKRSKVATTIARTTLNGIQNKVRTQFYSDNSKYIEGVKISVTFDGKTSDVCAGLSAKDELYPVGTDVTGQHLNCRSTMIAILKDEYDIFTSGKTKPSVGSDGVEQIPRNQRYDTWLRNQSAAFQREALGLTKYRLFKQGVKLDKFVDSDGSSLSVSELRQKYKKLL